MLRRFAFRPKVRYSSICPFCGWSTDPAHGLSGDTITLHLSWVHRR